MRGKVVFTDGEKIRAVKGEIYEQENVVVVENEAAILKIPLIKIFKIEYKKGGENGVSSFSK